jgi:multidrug efflux pump subunit AcrB
MVAMQVRQSIYGAEAGAFTENNEDIDIRVQYEPESRNSIESLKQITLTTLTGQSVTLSAVAEIGIGMGPLEIIHESQQRYVTVGANLNQISLGEGAKIARELLAETEIPAEISVRLSLYDYGIAV